MTSVHEGFVSRHLNRRMSRPLSRLLARTPLTPNQVSITAFAMALASLALFITGLNIWAGLVAQVSSVVDGADGDLARLKGMSSRFGGFFDAVLDRYADAAILGGMTYWAVTYGTSAASATFIATAGLMAVVGALIISYTRARAEATLGGAFEGLAGSLASRDLRLLVVMVGALIGQAAYTLVVLAVLTNAVVVWRILVARRASL